MTRYGAASFELALPALVFHATPLSRQCGPGRSPWFGGCGCFLDQRYQALPRILAILLLRPEPVCFNHERPLGRHAIGRQAQ